MPKSSIAELPPLPPLLRSRVGSRLENPGLAEPRLLVCSPNYRGVFTRLHRQAESIFDCTVIYAPQELRVAEAERALDVYLPAGDIKNLAVAAGGLANPVVSVLVALFSALGDVGWSLWRRRRRVPFDNPDDAAELVRSLLVTIARRGPALILIDSVRNETLWYTLEYVLSEGDLTAQPLVIMAGMDGPTAIDQDAESLAAWGTSVVRASVLCQADLAEWCSLPRLNHARIRQWHGSVETSLERLLIAASGGDDEMAGRIWYGWRSEHFIEQKNGVWAASKEHNHEPTRSRIFAILRRTVPPHIWSLARHALTCGALFGNDFSADVVADVAAATAATSDASAAGSDAVSELFEALTKRAQNVPWLLNRLSDVGIAVQVTKGPFNKHYEFASDLVAASLRSDVDQSRREELLQLLFNAAKVRVPERYSSASALARMARAMGNLSEAAYFEGLVSELAAIASLEVHATVLLTMTRNRHWDDVLVNDLVATAWRLVKKGLPTLALPLAERSVEMAKTTGAQSWLVAANHILGVAHLFRGDSGSSLPAIRFTFRYYQALRNETPSVPNRLSLASAYTDVGVAEREVGHYDEADRCLTAALGHGWLVAVNGQEDEARCREGLSRTLHELGRLEAARGRHAEASLLFRESLDIQLAQGVTVIDLQRNLEGTYLVLGRVELARGNYEEARRHLVAALLLVRPALACDPTPLVRARYSDVACELGRLQVSRRKFGAAHHWLSRALTQRRDLFAQDPNPGCSNKLAVVLEQWAFLEIARGRQDEARRYLSEALKHRRELVAAYPNQPHRDSLAALEELVHQSTDGGR